MWKITVINLVNNYSFGAVYENELDAIAWVDSQVQNNTWGNPARSLYEVPEELQSLITSQEEVLQNDEVTFRTLYHLKAEYEITGPIEILESDNNEDARKMRIEKANQLASMSRKYYAQGQMVKEYFTTLMAMRNLNSEQKTLIKNLPAMVEIEKNLLDGRLALAKQLAQALVADEAIIFQADIDKVTQLLDDLLVG